MAQRKTELQKRLEAEERETRDALANLAGHPNALATFRSECERLVQYAQGRVAACKATADQAVAEFRKAIESNAPLPEQLEKFFMAYYILELERAEDELKIAIRRRDLANGK
jgi:hypothetical protein